MFRFALDDLQAWLKDSSRKPLVVRGARQVGKTWLVRELARLNNLELIEINFELDPAKQILFTENEPQKVLMALEVNYNRQINLKKTLLFLDEVQVFPLMLAKLRWFKELMPELAVVVAGSLLEFALEEHSFSMPVGRISYLHLEPLSFEEFLYSRNQQLLKYLQKYNWQQQISEVIHQQALKHLQEYIIIGGLPAVVANWIQQESLIAVHQLQHDILTTYRDDFMRYKGKYDPLLFDDVFYYVPKNVGNKVVYSHINRNAQGSSLKNVFNLISKARVIHQIQATAANGIPLAAETNSKYIKAICLDVGLMNNILGVNLQDFKNPTDISTINKGIIAEQVVGQLLRTIEPYYIEPELYYWQRNHPGSNAEVDYLIQHNLHIIPIEVKAGSKGSMQSLHLFMKLKQLPLAIRFSTNLPAKMQIAARISTGEEVKYELLELPIYLVGQLRRLCASILIAV